MKHHGSLAAFDDKLLRPPDDLAAQYVARGKDQLEDYYGVRKTTLLRWLSELDEGLLKRRRSAHVKSSREKIFAGNRLTKVGTRLVIKHDVRPIADAVVKQAAHFLRHSKNGGWFVSITPFGDWWVGRMKLSGYELVEMAARKGFDVEAANLQLQVMRGVE